MSFITVRFHPRGATAAGGDASSPEHIPAQISSTVTDLGNDARSSRGSQASHSPVETDYDRPTTIDSSRFVPGLVQSNSFNSDNSGHYPQPAAVPPAMPSISYLTSSASHSSPRLYNRRTQSLSTPSPHSYPHEPPVISNSRAPAQPLSDGRRQFPLQDVQEACLLRYFIEEISHWVSNYLFYRFSHTYDY